jgi:hypothetical protein
MEGLRKTMSNLSVYELKDRGLFEGITLHQDLPGGTDKKIMRNIAVKVR